MPSYKQALEVIWLFLEYLTQENSVVMEILTNKCQTIISIYSAYQIEISCRCLYVYHVFARLTTMIEAQLYKPNAI